MRFYWPIAKIDAEQHMVWGYASTEAEDEQGEIVTRDALRAALDDYMRFANIREMHQNSAVGVATAAEVDERGLYLAANIVDAEAWRKVMGGVYKGFSIGGRVTQRDPHNRAVITGLKLTEISVVDRPANPEAVFDCWKLADPEDDDPASTEEEYADPGYQPDGIKRYPLDSERHIRAAWSYIHQARNAGHYTAEQLTRIRERIAAAWRQRIDPAGPPEAARKSLDDADRIAEIADRLEMLLDELRNLVAMAEDGLVAMAETTSLRKSAAEDAAEALAKLMDQVLPRLDALQQRVEDVARTPLPPQTIARGIGGLSKREDAGGGVPEDIVAALARMSEEERTLTLIKAAHANPIAARPMPR